MLQVSNCMVALLQADYVRARGERRVASGDWRCKGGRATRRTSAELGAAGDDRLAPARDHANLTLDKIVMYIW